MLHMDVRHESKQRSDLLQANQELEREKKALQKALESEETRQRTFRMG